MGFRFGLLSNRICKRSPDGIRSGSIMSDDVPTKQQLLEVFVPVPVWWPRRPHRRFVRRSFVVSVLRLRLRLPVRVMFPESNRASPALCTFTVSEDDICDKSGGQQSDQSYGGNDIRIPIAIFGRYSDMTCAPAPALPPPSPPSPPQSAEVNFVKGGINELN